MAKKTYKANILSIKSLDKLIEKVKKYNDDLTRKCELVIKKLIDIALPVIEQDINAAMITYDESNISSGADTSHYTDVNITSLNNYAKGSINVSGNQIVFIEFGSGVYHNTPAGSSPHPKGQEFGFVIGSYGEGHGVQKVWGYYDESGELILTHGVQATMPMYNAIRLMHEKAPSVVKEVFR